MKKSTIEYLKILSDINDGEKISAIAESSNATTYQLAKEMAIINTNKSMPLFKYENQDIEITDHGKKTLDHIRPELTEANLVLEKIKDSISDKTDVTLLLPQIIIQSIVKNIQSITTENYCYNIVVHTDSYFKDQDILLYDFVCITDNTFVPTIDCYDVVGSLHLSRQLCASPGYIKQHGIPKNLGDLLKNHTFVDHVYDKAHELNFEGDQSIKTDAPITVNNIDSYTTLLKSGMGIGRLSTHTIEQEGYFEKNLLMPILTDNQLKPYKFIMLKLKQSKCPVIVDAIIKQLEKTFMS